LAHLDAHRQRRAADAGGRDLRFLALALALLLAAGDVVLPGAVGAAGSGHGHLVRDEEVPGVAVGHVLQIAALSERRDILGQDHLHAGSSSWRDAHGFASSASRRWTMADVRSRAPGSRRAAARSGFGTRRRAVSRSRSSSRPSIPSW